MIHCMHIRIHCALYSLVNLHPTPPHPIQIKIVRGLRAQSPQTSHPEPGRGMSVSIYTGILTPYSLLSYCPGTPMHRLVILYDF